MQNRFTRRAAALAVAVLTAFALIKMPAAASDSVRYRVAAGDTLWKIAQTYATTAAEIMRLSGLVSDAIEPGMILIVSRPAAQEDKLYIEYMIKKGDTLGRLAETFGTEIAYIKRLNGLENDTIYAGATLKIPADYVEYKVAAGDTLYALGKKYGVTVEDIMRYSGITSDALRIGQTLVFPAVPESPLPLFPEPPKATAPSVAYITYIVQRGDTIWDISVRYGIPMQELLSDNGLNTESVLNLGQGLRVAVHTVPVKATPGAKYGEYLDWWTEAQYVVPIGKTVKLTDFDTGVSFAIRRTVGAGHADCEPLTAADTAAAKSVFGGFSWTPRAMLCEVDGRKLAASMTFYPHDIQSVTTNNFAGHFDLYFSNCIRHADGLPDPAHESMVKKAAGV
ncbi:MAG: LysM peptidoglycan-binding domain-containing protein [Oscillospiraceae bacterium]|jgi:LysM repeat protein|nr:LysM peptidoglycan-binding domain-containing protein [Oscillospiraceae bacterium]